MSEETKSLSAADIKPKPLSKPARRVVDCAPRDLKMAMRLATNEELAEARWNCQVTNKLDRQATIATEIKRRVK